MLKNINGNYKMITVLHKINLSDEHDEYDQFILSVDLIFTSNKSKYTFRIDLLENASSTIEKIKKFLTKSTNSHCDIIYTKFNNQSISYSDNKWIFCTDFYGQSDGSYFSQYEIECEHMKNYLIEVIKAVELKQVKIDLIDPYENTYKRGEIVDFPPK